MDLCVAYWYILWTFFCFVDLRKAKSSALCGRVFVHKVVPCRAPLSRFNILLYVCFNTEADDTLAGNLI